MRHANLPKQGPRTVLPVSAPLFFGLLSIFWLEYLRLGNYVPAIEVIKLNTLVPVLVAVATLVARGGRPNEEVFRARDTRLLLSFVAIFGVQMFVVDVRLYVYEIFKGFAGYLLLYYVLVRQLTTLHRLKIVLATLVMVHVVVLALSPSVILQPESRHRVGSTFLGDGNDFAWSVCVAIPFAVFLASTAKRPGVRYLFYGVSVLLTLAVIGTQSRGGSLALVSAGLYLTLMSKKRVRAFVGVGALVIVVLLFAPSTYFERMDTTADWQTEGSAQGRILAWETAVRMALDHPVVGVGAGHYVVKFGFEYKPQGYRGPYLNTHSIYFTMLAEFGFPGLMILLALIIGNLLRNQRLRAVLQRSITSADVEYGKLMTAMQASLIGFAVGGAFLSGVFYPHLFVLTGLMVSARFLSRARGEQSTATSRADTIAQPPTCPPRPRA